MAVVYNATVKNDRMDVVAAAMNAGSGAAVLQIGTAAMAAVLASVPLTDPVTVTADALNLLPGGASTIAASGTGTAAAARVRDSDGNDIVTGLTVGLSASNVILDSVNVTSGQDVTINTGVITHG
jgi:hypothetical protein